MSKLPKEKVPLKNSEGAVKYLNEFSKQLPPSDFLLEVNTAIKTKEDDLAFKLFIADRLENSCSVGYVDVLDQSTKVSKYLILTVFNLFLNSFFLFQLYV